MPLQETLRYLVTADSSGMVKELGKAQRSLKETGDSADKTANRNQKAARETVQSWEKTSSRMMTVGKTLAGGLAGLAVFSFVKDAANEAREAAQMTRETAQVIKTTGGVANVTANDVSKLADKFAGLAAIDDEVVQGGANVLLTFTNVRNEMGKGNQIFDETLRLSVDFAARFRKDLQPSIVMVGKALNDPIKGLASLGKAGVQFTAEQKEMIKALVESGHTLEAQKMILGELEKQVGGAAQAMADPMARFGVAVDDVKESVGTALLPVMEDLASAASDVADWFTNLSDSQQKWVIGLGAAVIAAGPVAGMLNNMIGLYKSLRSTALLAAAAQKLSAATGPGKLGGIAGGAVAGTTLALGLPMLEGRMQENRARAQGGVTDLIGDPQTMQEQERALALLRDRIAEINRERQEDIGLDFGKSFTIGSAAARDNADALKELLAAEKNLSTALTSEAFQATNEVMQGVMTTYFGVADAAGGVTDALAAQQMTAEGLKGAWEELLVPFLGQEQAYNNYEQSLINIDEQMKVLTDGVPDTQAALLGVGNTALDGAESFGVLAQKILEAGGTAETVEGAKQRMITSLTALGEHADGPTKEQIQRTIDKLHEFDTLEAVATVNVDGNAEQKIASIGSAIDEMFEKAGIPKGDFVRNILGNLGKESGGVIGMAAGGRIDADVYKMGTGGGKVSDWTAVVGEGDAPEYVIPTDPRYRRRAIALMTDASRDLGITGLASGGVIDFVADAAYKYGGDRSVSLAEALFGVIKRYGGGKGRQAADFARAQVGKPYVWGATGPGAYDCSGLTQAAWRSAGVGIPRVSHAQIAAARALGMGEATGMPGALFYRQSAASPSGGHIAMSHGDGSLSNAQGSAYGVRVTGTFPGRQGIPNFDRGGTLRPGLNVVHNGTGGPERLSPNIPTVTVHVHGNVLTESDLVEVVHRGLLDKQRRVATLGLR